MVLAQKQIHTSIVASPRSKTNQLLHIRSQKDSRELGISIRTFLFPPPLENGKERERNKKIREFISKLSNKQKFRAQIY